MRLEAGTHLERRRLHLDEIALGEGGAECRRDPAARDQELAFARETIGTPPGFARIGHADSQNLNRLVRSPIAGRFAGT